MMKASITPQARADLRDISRYTDKKWGRQQRFNYIRRLKERFAYLAEKPHMGRNRDEIIDSPYSYHGEPVTRGWSRPPERTGLETLVHSSPQRNEHISQNNDTRSQSREA